LELGERRHQRLGDVLAPVGAEAVLDRAHDVVRAGTCAGPRGRACAAPGGGACAPATDAENACSFSGSFTPGSRSTPLATSTANGPTAAIASTTFSGVRPPLRIIGAERWCARAISHENVSPV